MVTTSENATIIDGGISFTDDPFTIINGLIGSAIVLMNSFTISLFCYKTSLLRSSLNQMLLSLAVCDLASGLNTCLHVILIETPSLALDRCARCVTFRILADIFTTFLTVTTVFHLCGIAIDRYISLFYALRYQKIVTPSKVRKFLILSWVTSFFASAMQIMWLYLAMDGLTEEERRNLAKYDAWYSVGSLFQFMIFPMLLLAWLFSRMYFKIGRLQQRLLVPSGIVDQQSLDRQRHVCTVFAIMYASFIFFSVPYFMIRLIQDCNVWLSESNQIHVDMMTTNVFYTAKTLTAILNPLLYTIYNRSFRHIACNFVASVMERIQRFFRSSAVSANVSFSWHQAQTLPYISSRAEPTFHDSESGNFECRRMVVDCKNRDSSRIRRHSV